MRASAKIIAGLAAAALTAEAFSASAQTAGWAGLPMQATVMRNMLNNATRGRAGPYVSSPGQGPTRYGMAAGRFASRPVRPMAFASLPYVETPAVTSRVVASYLADVRRNGGPAAADRLQQVLAKTDFRSEWSRMVAADGLRRGDLVDAMTGYWVLNWMVVHHAENTRAQTLAARAQVARAVSAMPGLVGLDPAGRQAFAETLMLRQVIQAALYLNALRTHDEAGLQRLAAGTQSDFSRDFGMNLAAYALTPRGFVAAG